MSFARPLNDPETKKLQTFVLFSGAFTTLAVWTNLEDPINLPKMFVLVLFGAAVLGLSLPALLSARKESSQNQKISLFLSCLFAIGLLISTAATDVRYTAIFGEYHRNNGALSYLAMVAILLGSVVAFNLKSLTKFFNFFSATGILLAMYGTLQGMGKDPVSWVIQYNPFVTTLGNPNFTSAFLGLSGIAILFSALNSKNKNFQAICIVGLLLNIFVLYKTGSIQGVFGLLIGSALIVITKIWITNKRLGQAGMVTLGLISIPVLLALVNVGPLASKIYQGTLKNRIDYWNAALAMFKDHPVLGVGTDRFGEFYREYAFQNQAVQGQVTDNAHSVYLQLLATGGLVTFVPYILLVIFVTYIGVSCLIKANNQEKFIISGILGIWLATIAINLVTVDSLGVSVWFWITAGILISTPNYILDFKSDTNIKIKNKPKTKDDEFPIGYLSAAILSISALIILMPQINKSENLFELKKTIPGLSSQEYVGKVLDSFDPAETNTQFLIQLSDLAFRQGAIVDGLKMIDRVNEVDHRSYYGNYFAAMVYESTERKSQAIKYRERLATLDPWNNASLLELIKDYLAVGNKDSASSIAALIRKNYPGSQADIEASALLVG
jgi:O-antigen ligase